MQLLRSELYDRQKEKCPQFKKQIKIIQDDDRYIGKFEELDDEGCLLLRTESGDLKKIVAGDLEF